MKKRWIFLVPAAIAAMLLFAALGGVVVQQLWNWLLPPIFNWPAISFWQGLGLLALCRILFGGFGCHGSHRPGFRRHKHGSPADRWDAMTPDERERFRQGVRQPTDAATGGTTAL